MPGVHHLNVNRSILLFIRYCFGEGFTGEVMVMLRGRGRPSDLGLPNRHSVVYSVPSNDSVSAGAKGVVPAGRQATV